MTSFAKKIWLIFLLILPFAIQLEMSRGNALNVMVRADDDQQDLVDGEEDQDASIESEDIGPDVADADVSGTDAAATAGDADVDKEEDEDAEKLLKPSPDAETTILFIHPTGLDFPAGQNVRFLVGFINKGEKDFIVETMDAAFRYPQDYSFYIQNFTAYRYYRTVEPKREATFEYSFAPSETFSARPFGLTINLNYKDAEGNYFQDAVFNQTINISEPDEGLDGETFFLYIFLAAIVVLLVVGAQQMLGSFGKKHLSSKPKVQVEMGTQNNKTDVDFDWLPRETLQDLNRSPIHSQKSKVSPKQRSTKRRSGATED